MKAAFCIAADKAREVVVLNIAWIFIGSVDTVYDVSKSMGRRTGDVNAMRTRHCKRKPRNEKER